MENTVRSEGAEATGRRTEGRASDEPNHDSEPIYEDEYGNIVPSRPAPSGGAAYSALPTGEAAVNIGVPKQGEYFDDHIQKRWETEDL